MKKDKILVATSKGLVIWQKKDKLWSLEEVHFRGMPVNVVFVDPQNGDWWLGLTHRHWGQKLYRSTNEGKDWEALNPPHYPKDVDVYPNQRTSLKKIWCIESMGIAGGLWLGTEPGGLFRSDNFGKDFQLVESLWNHPSRRDENQWFGAGRDFPFIHSIVVDPRDRDHVYIAVSCAGIFETKDGGENWAPKNKGLKAAYLPKPDVEVGHDPHRLLLCAAAPDVLWQQNHCGIFRSTNGGEEWEDVSDKNGIASYGFALAIDQEDPLTAWVIPAISDEERVAQDLALCVCRTNDGGQTWLPLREGLPQEFCFDIVFRHSLAIADKTLVFGTSTGNIYLSENGGNTWQQLSGNLARVESVTLI